MGQCSECVFYEDGRDEWDNRGKCRRYPPAATGEIDTQWSVSFWATVRKQDWCGEFKPARAGEIT